MDLTYGQNIFNNRYNLYTYYFNNSNGDKTRDYRGRLDPYTPFTNFIAITFYPFKENSQSMMSAIS